MSLLVSDAPKIFYEVCLQSPDSVVSGVFCEQSLSFDLEDDAIDFVLHAVGHPFVGARIYLCRIVYITDFIGAKIERRLMRDYGLYNNGVYLNALYLPFNLSSVFGSPSDSSKEAN